MSSLGTIKTFDTHASIVKTCQEDLNQQNRQEYLWLAYWGYEDGKYGGNGAPGRMERHQKLQAAAEHTAMESEPPQYTNSSSRRVGGKLISGALLVSGCSFGLHLMH